MGEYSYRDVVKEDGIPAIVSKELFEQVQTQLAKNKKAPARHKAEGAYLLTTKLYCGKCNSFMVGESGTSKTMKVHHYYRCVNTKKKKLCTKKAVKKDWIENLVIHHTMNTIMNDEIMERLIDTLMDLQKKENTELPLLKKQLAETQKGINNMLNAIQAGIFTPSTKQRLDELEETKSKLEVSILQEEMQKPMLTREQVAFFIYRFREFDVANQEQRQRLIDSFVNAVYLYEDKVVLTFNYKEGSKTVTLAEVESSDLSCFGAAYNPSDYWGYFLLCCISCCIFSKCFLAIWFISIAVSLINIQNAINYILTFMPCKIIIVSMKVNKWKEAIVGATEEIIKMAKENNGTVTTAMVVAAGFSRGNIKYLVDKGMIEKSTRGVYILPEVWHDEIFNMQSRFKRGIYSHETALFLWDLTDRTPNRYHMTFPANYNLTKPKEKNIRCVQCKDILYDLGITVVTTPGGNTVRAYSVERTLCDILRSHSRVDIQIVTEAFKRYAISVDKNIPVLSEYAKMLRVEKKLRAYLEVLL